MRHLILFGFLALCLLLVADYTIAALQSRALISRVGNDDVLHALNDLIAPGMTRSEAERLINGYREARIYPADGDEYSVSYRYWFGLIPPLGTPEIKLIGAIEVEYSKDWYVQESHYWIN